MPKQWAAVIQEPEAHVVGPFDSQEEADSVGRRDSVEEQYQSMPMVAPGEIYVPERTSKEAEFHLPNGGRMTASYDDIPDGV